MGKKKAKFHWPWKYKKRILYENNPSEKKIENISINKKDKKTTENIVIAKNEFVNYHFEIDKVLYIMSLIFNLINTTGDLRSNTKLVGSVY